MRGRGERGTLFPWLSPEIRGEVGEVRGTEGGSWCLRIKLTCGGQRKPHKLYSVDGPSRAAASSQTGLSGFSMQRRVLCLNATANGPANENREPREGGPATKSRDCSANLQRLHFHAFPIFPPDSILHRATVLERLPAKPNSPRRPPSRVPPPCSGLAGGGGVGFL